MFSAFWVQPCASQVEVPHVAWTDIGGYAELKAALREAVEWPLQHAELFAQLGITPPRGVLLSRAAPPST